jgi:uncharacterized protein
MLFFFMIVFCCLMIFVASAIIFIGSKGDSAALTNLFSGNASVSILKLIQSAQTIGLFMIPPFVAAWLFEPEGISFLNINRKPTIQPILLFFLLVFSLLPLINWLASINQAMHLPQSFAGVEKWIRDAESQAAVLTDKFLFAKSFGDVLLNVCIIALLPAIGEELFFRAMVQQYIIKAVKNVHWGVWIAAIFFSAFHLQFLGFLPRVLLGAVLGYLYVWSSNLWYPIVFHFFNNALMVVSYSLHKSGKLGVDPDKFGTSSSDIWGLLVSIPVVFFLIVLIYKKIKSNQTI